LKTDLAERSMRSSSLPRSASHGRERFCPQDGEEFWKRCAAVVGATVLRR
jgi:hypothetical protein